MHRPPLRHGRVAHSSTSSAHVGPAYPDGQRQVKLRSPSTHVPECRHGFSPAQKSTSLSHCSPENPWAQGKRYCTDTVTRGSRDLSGHWYSREGQHWRRSYCSAGQEWKQSAQHPGHFPWHLCNAGEHTADPLRKATLQPPPHVGAHSSSTRSMGRLSKSLSRSRIRKTTFCDKLATIRGSYTPSCILQHGRSAQGGGFVQKCGVNPEPMLVA
mmetsp:Transcript_41619/g.109647  ORF Transcript_41619/g.109647 Transcript_41619/m.109647 type:complete len:213 (+) Transcript_41619:1746-2384(+)